MKRLHVFFIISIVVNKCCGGLIGDFFNTAHGVTHGVAEKVIGGFNKATGINFHAGGHFGANSHGKRPGYGYQQNSEPDRPDTTIIVIKDQDDGPPGPPNGPYRPPGPPNGPYGPPGPQNRPHGSPGPPNRPYGKPNGPEFNRPPTPGYQQRPQENNNYNPFNNNQGDYGQQNPPNSVPHQNNNYPPNNNFGGPNQNDYTQNQNGFVPNNQKEYNYNNQNDRPNQSGQNQQSNNNFAQNKNVDNNQENQFQQNNNDQNNFNQNNYRPIVNENNNQYQPNNPILNDNNNNNAEPSKPSEEKNPVEKYDFGDIFTSSTESNKINNQNVIPTKIPDKKDDGPLLVPLAPNQYVYGGDKIEVNAPKRETNPKQDNDYDDLNLDIRSGDS